MGNTVAEKYLNARNNKPKFTNEDYERELLGGRVDLFEDGGNGGPMSAMQVELSESTLYRLAELISMKLSETRIPGPFPGDRGQAQGGGGPDLSSPTDSGVTVTRSAPEMQTTIQNYGKDLAPQSSPVLDITEIPASVLDGFTRAATVLANLGHGEVANYLVKLSQGEILKRAKTGGTTITSTDASASLRQGQGGGGAVIETPPAVQGAGRNTIVPNR
jgi:hypothetical protein